MLTQVIKVAGCALLTLALAITSAYAAEPGKTSAAGTMTIPAMITGTLSYRERIALAPGSEALVQLLDSAAAGAPAKVMVEQRIVIAKQVPIEFRLDYDAVQIDPKHTYTVAARIVNGDKLLFVSDTPNHVITRGSPGHLELVLKKPAAAKQ